MEDCRGPLEHCRGSYGKNCLEADPEFAFEQFAFFGIDDEPIEPGCRKIGTAVVVERFERWKIDRQPEDGRLETEQEDVLGS